MKKQSNPKIYWCERILFYSPVHYTVCATEEQFHRELRKMKLPPKEWPNFLGSDAAQATTTTFSNDGSPELCIVTVRDVEKRNGIELAALLVHEAVHIWQVVRERIGEKEPSPEFEAYAIQNIAQELMVAYCKATGRKIE